MFNIEKETNKGIIFYTILAVVLAVYLIIVFPRITGTFFIIISLVYVIVEIISLCILKRKIKKNVPPDYNVSRKEQIIKTYKNTKIISLVNDTVLIIMIIILIIIQIIIGDYDIFAVTIIVMGGGIFSLVKLAK